jgi:hypothetical protein
MSSATAGIVKKVSDANDFQNVSAQAIFGQRSSAEGLL